MDIIPHTGFWAMIQGATLVVKLVLALLALMSLASWTIIFYKLIQLSGARKKVAAGTEAFAKAETLNQALNQLGPSRTSPLARISALALEEYRRLERAKLTEGRAATLVVDTLRRVLRQGVSSELKAMAASVSFLATCANAAPFIGLFGTVWGIMNSFHAIGQAKSAALATVAPGISEALVATAIGLGVAIPATLAYNYFLSVLNNLETGLVNFAGMFLNRVEAEAMRHASARQRTAKPKPEEE